MNSSILKEIEAIQNGTGPEAMLVMIVASEGSVPRPAGAKMIVRKDGSIIGTIGGGAIEMRSIETAQKLLGSPDSTHLEKFNLGQNISEGNGLGMLCGGSATVYFERIRGFSRLFIYGGGHIAAALAPIAAGCRFAVTVIDDRPEIATVENYRDTAQVALAHPVEHASELTLVPDDFIVIVTHSHKYDAAVLQALLEKPIAPRYLGMIGSKRKVRIVLDSMIEKGIARERVQAVRTPIGLKIGGDNPMEIAVSIMAEIMGIKYSKIKNGYVQSMSD